MCSFIFIDKANRVFSESKAQSLKTISVFQMLEIKCCTESTALSVWVECIDLIRFSHYINWELNGLMKSSAYGISKKNRCDAGATIVPFYLIKIRCQVVGSFIKSKIKIIPTPP